MDKSPVPPVETLVEDVSAVKTDGAVLGIVLFGLAAAGAAWWVIASVGRPSPPAPSTISVSVLDEPDRTGRAQVLNKSESAAAEVAKENGRPATFLDIARATNGKTFLGKMIRLKAVPVISISSDHALTVGPGDEDSILVKLPPGISDRKLSPGQSVFLVGRLMPSPTQQTEHQWGVTAEDENRIGHRTFYIEATVLHDAAAPG